MSVQQATSSSPVASDLSLPERRRHRAPLVALALSLAAGAALGARYWVTLGVQATDDAHVEGHVISVSARVSGQVLRVHVQHNQSVSQGDVLVEIDPTDYIVKVEAARADLAAARAAASGAEYNVALARKSAPAALEQAHGGVKTATSALSSAQGAIEKAAAELRAAESRQELADIELRRVETLLKSGAVTQAALDLQQTESQSALAARQQAEAQLVIARANLDASGGNATFARGRLRAAETCEEQIALAQAALTAAEARVRQMEAALKTAELNLSYTTLRAVRPGVVSRRSVEEGQLVSPDRPLLALVPLDDVWVVANFKEGQLTDMRTGQSATVTVDTYSQHVLTGHVESIGSGTGARFALLPPDNAGGNFVKVAQRIPVLIRLDQAQEIELRLGMSAEVTVDARQR